MNKATGSFQDNIRRVFIRFSLLPVGIIAALAIALFALLWTYFTAHFNEQDSKNAASEISRTINICYNMLTDVERSISDAGGNVESDQIFPILYRSTAEFGEIGDLTVLTADREVAFSSKESVPEHLTGEVYSDWGVWHAVKAGKGTTATVLYNKSLYVAKGVYVGDELSCAIVYEIPKDVITRATGELNRYFAITDKYGWIYECNTDILRDSFGRIPYGQGPVCHNGQRHQPQHQAHHDPGRDHPHHFRRDPLHYIKKHRQQLRAAHRGYQENRERFRSSLERQL